MTLSGNWFTERSDEGGSAFSYKIKSKLHEEQSEYQQIEVFETEKFGKLMVIDGFIMLTQRDNYIYHEMITHPALYTHPDPRRVLIIGGGDCGTLKEVLKHPTIELVQQVEIDERVTRVSEEYFPELCESNGDARAELRFDDGIKWVEEAQDDYYDVIIIDSTDPIGPAVGLFSEPFYTQCLRALGKKGLLIQQSESPLYHMKLIARMYQEMRNAGFIDVMSLFFPQCSYPSGWWTTTMASKGDVLSQFREQDAQNKSFQTRYYNAAVHRGAMAAPESFYKELASL